MSLSIYFKRAQTFTYLVENTQTGTLQEVSNKLRLSLRAFHEFKDQLKDDFGLPIAYCRKRQTYFYKKKGRLRCAFGS